MTGESECVILGGGVIGLSLAYELSRRDMRVAVIDRGQPGQEASWAGAGILPPANRRSATDPLDQLRGLSHDLHPLWAQSLFDETGIDNGFRQCGGLYLAHSPGEAAALLGLAGMLREAEIEIERIGLAELRSLEPALTPLADSGQLRAAYWLPGEAQLRNPRHVRALQVACQRRGVQIRSGLEVRDFVIRAGRLEAVVCDNESFRAGQFCVASGAWSYGLLEKLGIETGILPIRGQMVLFQCEHPLFDRVLNEGPRYLVPRDDGRVLAGSTEEEAGFDRSTTPEVVHELIEFACQIIPQLRNARIEKSWAGLRPGSFDGLPYLGRLPDLENAYVAAGHYRSGIHLSTGTARVIAQLMCGESPEIDLTAFQVHRGSASAR